MCDVLTCSLPRFSFSLFLALTPSAAGLGSLGDALEVVVVQAARPIGVVRVEAGEQCRTLALARGAQAYEHARQELGAAHAVALPVELADQRGVELRAQGRPEVPLGLGILRGGTKARKGGAEGPDRGERV